MRESLRQLVLFASGILLALYAMTAEATRQDLEARWQEYASSQTALEPAFKFPHATCFKAAALQYGLPESLLLAVARGESDFEPTARSKANAASSRFYSVMWWGRQRSPNSLTPRTGPRL